MGGLPLDIEELQAGSTLGPFHLLAPIGTGGMARVWAARVRGTTEIVALKMLLPELAQNIEFRKMFLDEARIASRVRHPNVCSTLKMGEQCGVLYLTMEWLDGASLIRLIRPGPHDPTTGEYTPLRARIAARIIADTCAGLHAAHELVDDDGRPLGVVHRDVSPHNLLITAEGIVKVTDFGVAKALGKTHRTVAGQLKGKLAYMSPEQIVGGPVDRRSDVFSLGCVLYEITTGKRPFRGNYDPQLMTAIVLGRYEAPAAIVPNYPPQLALIVRRALANAAEQRYPSADHMRQALEAYLRDSGPNVGPAQIAALLRERCGDEPIARADAVRKLAEASPEVLVSEQEVPAETTLDSSVSMRIAERSPASHRRLAFLWATLVGAILGALVLAYVRTVHKPKSASARNTGTPSLETSHRAAPSTSFVETGRSPPSRGGASTTTHQVIPGQAVPTASPIRLHITPESAVVILDGIVLPRGMDTIAKPALGTVINVLVRADKHEDAVLTLDSTTPEDIAVALIPKTLSKTIGKVRRSVDAGTTAPPEIPGPETPPNPYD